MQHKLKSLYYTFEYVLKELFVPILPVTDEKSCGLINCTIDPAKASSFRALTNNVYPCDPLVSSLWREIAYRSNGTSVSPNKGVETNLLTKALYISPVPIDLVDGKSHTVFFIGLTDSNSGISLKIWKYISDFMFGYKNELFRIDDSLSDSELNELSKLGSKDVVSSLFALFVSKYNYAAVDYKIKDFVGYSSWIHLLINDLEVRSKTTYEGSHYPFACILCKEKCKSSMQPRLIDFLHEDASFLFSDGIQSWHRVSCDGFILNYIDRTSLANEQIRASTSTSKNYAPYEYEVFASACTGDNIGIILRSTGEILIFYHGALQLAKKSKWWIPYDCSTFIDLLVEKFSFQSVSDSRKLAGAVYETILDVSFGTGGGCIGILDKCTYTARFEEIKKFDNHVIAKFLSPYIGSRFDDIPRHIRHQLVSIDGSTIISKQGALLCAGKILRNISPCPGKGARYAAAKSLGQGEDDLGIKLSEDGGAIAFSDDNIVLQIL